MRLISQNQTLDVPYDRVILAARKTGRTTYVVVADEIGGEIEVMGEYDSMIACQKVMAAVCTAYMSERKAYRFPDADAMILKEGI